LCADTIDGTEHFVHDSHLISTARSLFQDAKSRARKSGRPFTIREEDIVIPKFCPVLDIELIPARGQQWDQSPTLDAMNNEEGYVPGNVWVVSMRANRLKGDGSSQEHRAIALHVDAVEMFGNNTVFDDFKRRRYEWI
jgi:hypothetical protein